MASQPLRAAGFEGAALDIWLGIEYVECRRPPHRASRDEDVELWARAERYAKARRMPVSGLVMAALQAYLADVDDGR